MKKKLAYLIIMMFYFIPSIVSADTDKIKVYLFKGDGCPHCEDALEFFNALSEEDKSKFDLVEYEVWYNEYNNNLMNKVANKLGDTGSGVPYIIVGAKSFRGFNDETGEIILKSINEMYENKDFVDVMDSLESPDSDNVGVLVIGGIVAVIICFLLVKVRRKI